MRKPRRQTLITFAALTAAFGAIALASIYSGDQAGSPIVNTGAAADGPVTNGITPVEGWYPRTGQGGACSEQVGVDLIDGYAATLTINGVPIAENEMNTYELAEADDGTRSTVLSAGGSLGQFTWGPEPDCPAGVVLRPQNNEVVACVFEIGDSPANCLPYRYSFDVL